MIKWLFEHVGIVVVLVLFLTQIVRAFLQSRNANPGRPNPRGDDNDERRVREVQEQIRRQIAERRRAATPANVPPPLSPSPEARPIARPHTTQMPEPFAGPLGRM